MRARMLLCVLIGVTWTAIGVPSAEASASRRPCDGDGSTAVTCTGEGSVADGAFRGLLYVGGIAAVSRAEVGAPEGCATCVWTVEVLCKAPLPGEDNQDCQGGDLTCFRQGKEKLLVSLALGAGPPSQVADYCQGPIEQHPVVSQATFDAEAAARSRDLHPAAPALTHQPPDGAITQLPTYVLVRDTPAALHQGFGLTAAPGLTETVDFAPSSHHWHWGDGSTDQLTASPGGSYPSGDVTHTYTRRGSVTLTETTTYAASYVVHTPDGIDLPRRTTPGDVQGDTAHEPLTVREGRAELTTP